MTPLLPYLKFLHFCGLLLWCAGLFALPALLSLYARCASHEERVRVVAATRFTYVALASPAAVVAVASGTAMVHATGSYGGWMLAKLTLVTGMVFFHALCAKLILVLQRDPRAVGAGWLLSTALVPLLLVPGVLAMVLWQPRFGGG
ncbi:MAG: CopD family protein [Xylophilus ampelinus]